VAAIVVSTFVSSFAHHVDHLAHEDDSVPYFFVVVVVFAAAGVSVGFLFLILPSLPCLAL
jgi:hypothetical protein